MGVLIYVVSLLVFWAILTAKADDPTRVFTFNITEGPASPVPGSSQGVILINGQFPGPPIECVTNDNIVVNVFNNLKDPFLITWNGIKQRKNSWQDGVLGTNCPILPNTNWTYKFQAKDQIGTYTYFPSMGMQKAVSYGAFNVLSRPLIPIPYPTPAGNDSLLIGEWYNQSYKVLNETLDSGKGLLPAPIALLINGHASYNFTGDQGKQYMFRVSNVGLSTSINFRIQDHMLNLVEVEGCHVLPNMYNSLDIYVGQSMTVLVTLNQSSNASYYIVASSTFSDITLNVTGVLRYRNSIAKLPVKPIPIGPKSNVRWSMDQARSIRWYLNASAARPNPQGSFHYSKININTTIILENSAHLVSRKQRYYLNHISYINPSTCLKLADNLTIKGVFNLTFPGNDSKSDYYKQGTYVFPTLLHEFMEIIFQNNGNALEVFHLDGYDFWVVGMGSGNWTSNSWNGSDAYNLLDAYTRNTVQVYPHSWTAIYVSLDNEGMWNLRSALWPRQYLGQQLYVRVKNLKPPNPRKPTEYPIPDNAIYCGLATKGKL